MLNVFKLRHPKIPLKHCFPLKLTLFLLVRCCTSRTTVLKTRANPFFDFNFLRREGSLLHTSAGRSRRNFSPKKITILFQTLSMFSHRFRRKVKFPRLLSSHPSTLECASPFCAGSPANRSSSSSGTDL